MKTNAQTSDAARLGFVGRCRAILFTWRTARRLAVGTAVLATLLAVLYAEENWRGKRAWEQCKRDLAAKGEVLDWNAYIPPAVPDEENIMKAPKMTEWFVKPSPLPLSGLGAGSSNELSAILNRRKPSEIMQGNETREIIFLSRVSVAPANGAEAIIRLDDPKEADFLRKFVDDKIGPRVFGVKGVTTFVRHPLSHINPGRFLLQADTPPTLAGISRLLPSNAIPAEVGRLRVEADAGKDAFRVLLVAKPTLSAEEYLTWTDRFAPEFDLIRQALQRPHLRMDDDYERPFQAPVVNFVSVRDVAQMAAQRAQCYLLLGRSEQALRELSLIFELRRLLAAKPTLLVAAMIDVALAGLDSAVIADGFRLQAWREPELVALQKQLQQFNLLPELAASLRTERAAVCRLVETVTVSDMPTLFSADDPKAGFWKRIPRLEFLLWASLPRGWTHQNLVRTVYFFGLGIEALNAPGVIVSPRKLDTVNREMQSKLHRRSIFDGLAAVATPDYIRAIQTTVKNQTLINQAFVACGLERYHLAHGSYPETLDVLVPQFAERIPLDVIGGQPLHYRRTPDGKFLLYSVGWNEKDDGGESASEQGKDDWLWPLETK